MREAVVVASSRTGLAKSFRGSFNMEESDMKNTENDAVNHPKQTKLQKDARYQVNRSHNRRCSDHR